MADRPDLLGPEKENRCYNETMVRDGMRADRQAIRSNVVPGNEDVKTASTLMGRLSHILGQAELPQHRPEFACIGASHVLEMEAAVPDEHQLGAVHGELF